jgi:hypothetical protein
MEITVRLVLPRFGLASRGRAVIVALFATTLLLAPVIALASDVFGDVPGTLPQHDAINRVYAAGIMRACTAGSPPNFCPNDPVLRAQQASQWDRALGLNGTVTQGTYVQRASTMDRPGFKLSTLDSAGAVGAHSSLAIGIDGLGLVSYFDVTNGDLKVAHCGNVACTTDVTSTLDSTGNVGQFNGIAIGDDGLGLISYYDQTSGDLKVAHCLNLSCTAATTSAVEAGGNDVGRYASMAIGADGSGLISYWDATNDDLKVAHCSNTACSSATTSTIDSTNSVGLFTSIAIGIDGLGLIS